MPTMTKTENGKLLNWATDLQDNTMQQATNMANMPFVQPHAALMADAHYGYGVPIGAVIPTVGAIMPAAVGVDIGCGMIAVQTSLMAHDLPDDLNGLLSAVENAVPATTHSGRIANGTRLGKRQHALFSLGLEHQPERMETQKLADKACAQLGTLGSGNHFVEICLDETEVVWVVLHSGSRGIGNIVARDHINLAKGIMKRYFIDVPDPDLSYFVEGTPEFAAYLRDLNWAQNYAMTNRDLMMDAVLVALEGVTDDFDEYQRVNCHHNYTAKENHFGRNVWVTRKGAIRAQVGDLGVIPGSMGTNSYIVRGLGNKGSFNSASHGAGRTMSRTQARKELTLESFAEAMQGRTWLDGKATALLDEHPSAYKDIEQVMRNQADLVTIEHELHAIVNYKGA